MNIINEEKIFGLLENAKNTGRNDGRLDAILEKAVLCKGLTEDEVAELLMIEQPEELRKLFDAAREVKQKVYGKRVVLFAPIYTSNECTNNCLYCAFRHDNAELHRRTLTVEEIVEEAGMLEKSGHKRILLICGEDNKKAPPSHFAEAMRAIYDKLDIRRINIEAAPMSVEEYRMLKEAGIGTYVIFQETYHRETYKKMHPSGTKANYDNRITAIDRAFMAGIDDVGIGPLLGLYDYHFEVLAVMQHIAYFEGRFGVGPHTISVPRLQPAMGSKLGEVPYPVSDNDFRKIVSIFRLAVPYTGIILSTREPAGLRDELLSLGVSQISAGSNTAPGGYGQEEHEKDEPGQFSVSDHRTLPEVLETICDKGYIPSFCTACYRRKRTGEAFMNIAKEGEIHEFCQPNAILTFKENLLDYGSPELNEKGNRIIEKALSEIDDDSMRQLTIQKIKEIEAGARDLFF